LAKNVLQVHGIDVSGQVRLKKRLRRDEFEDFFASLEPTLIGPITASAIAASIADAAQFASGRQFAAWLGLVPQQRSSDGKERLGGITKRGDGYIRQPLIHGARAVVGWRRRSTMVKDRWVSGLLHRRPFNVATVALANKNARIAWAVMATGKRYDPRLARAA
jgi:transposase